MFAEVSSPDEAEKLAKRVLGAVAHGADPAAATAADRRGATLREMAELFLVDHVAAKRSKLPGFGLRVQPSGVMSYVAKYRAGSGRAAPTRRVTLGRVGKITGVQSLFDGTRQRGRRVSREPRPYRSDAAE
jgi:Arm DNA-binding domain